MAIIKKWLDGLSAKKSSSIQTCSRTRRLTTTTTKHCLCRRLWEAEEGRDDSWRVLACIFSASQVNKAWHRQLQRTDHRKEMTGIQIKHGLSLPLAYYGSSSLHARPRLKFTARSHHRQWFLLSVGSAPRAVSSEMERLQRQQHNSSVILQSDENALSFHTHFLFSIFKRVQREDVTALQRLALPLLGRDSLGSY